MGGGATWRYALAHPDRVSAMLLIDAVPPGDWQGNESEDEAPRDDENSRSAPMAFSLLRQPWFRAIARYLDPKPLIAQGLRSAYNDSPVVDDILVERYYELIMRKGTRAAIMSRTGSVGADSMRRTDLSDLSQPTLIMWGAQDSVIPVSTVEIFERSLPNTSTVIYEDLGHIPMEEDPERTAADVLSFLQNIGS